MDRRTFLAAALAFAAPCPAWAQAYPARDIHFICAFEAGSGADVLVRFFADKISKLTRTTVVVENKAGAAGNIAAQYTARSKPDGYTVFVHAGNSIAANMHLFKNPPVNVGAELQVVATINKQPFMLTVAPTSPIKTVQELTEHLKKKGDSATYGTTATTGKVMGEAYKQLAGVTATEVRYRNGQEAMNDLLSGTIDYAVNDPVLALSQAREGRLRILAVSAGERMKSQPTLPTMREQGVNMDQLGWWGAFVPSGTPKPIVDTLNDLFGQVLRTEEAEKFLNSFGGDVFISAPDDGQKLLLRSIAEWGDYVRMANIPQN